MPGSGPVVRSPIRVSFERSTPARGSTPGPPDHRGSRREGAGRREPGGRAHLRGRHVRSTVPAGVRFWTPRRGRAPIRAMETSGPSQDALVAELAGLCAGLPGAERYVMVHHPAFRVRKKPFAVVGLRKEGGDATVAINLGLEEQGILLGNPRFARTPYIGQHGWVTVARADLTAAELEMFVTESWRRVAGKRNVAAFESRDAASAPAKRPSMRRGK